MTHALIQCRSGSEISYLWLFPFQMLVFYAAHGIIPGLCGVACALPVVGSSGQISVPLLSMSLEVIGQRRRQLAQFMPTVFMISAVHVRIWGGLQKALLRREPLSSSATPRCLISVIQAVRSPTPGRLSPCLTQLGLPCLATLSLRRRTVNLL